jgi:hypothetical protein
MTRLKLVASCQLPDSIGAMPSARATHAPHRARILGLGLSVGIAIALGGCDQSSDPRLKECRYMHPPALSHAMSGTFRYIEDDVFVDGPNMARKVVDTEGWERRIAHKGPDAVICRRVHASAMSGSAQDAQRLDPKGASAVAKRDAQ